VTGPAQPAPAARPERTATLAISPCPNDTFVFHALIHGLVAGAPAVETTFADIDVCNGIAEVSGADLVKISVAMLPWVLDKYQLLPCGGAVGHGCGPLVLSRTDTTGIAGARVAIPGERTTAYQLFQLWTQSHGGQPAQVVVMPFEQIMPAVRAGAVDLGLVIHEARFTYPDYGLQQVADLGEWWEADTGLPVPLGAIVARRDQDASVWTSAVRSSVEMAWAHPEASREFVRHHAQETAPAVVDAHIRLYVNEFTRDLGSQGREAIRVLLGRAAQAGVVPPTPGLL